MPARRVGGQILDGQDDQWRGSAQPPVVGRGARQVREQVPEPAAGEPQPAPLGTAPEQDLSDGQTDQLGVAQLGPTARAQPWAEQLVDGDVQCDDEGVEIGGHEASQEVDVAFATPILGALVSPVTPQHPQPDSEAII
jgi:hypothetical protein